MNIDKLLKESASNLKSLSARLDIQAGATRDRDDKTDIAEHSMQCMQQVLALNAIRAAYGPIIQCAIDSGCRGRTHRIVVQEVQQLHEDGSPIWRDVSSHEFTVDAAPMVQ